MQSPPGDKVLSIGPTRTSIVVEKRIYFFIPAKSGSVKKFKKFKGFRLFREDSKRGNIRRKMKVEDSS